jgi:hypothetical protein
VTIDFAVFRSDKTALLDELRAAGAEIPNPERDFCCPFHDDSTPSMGLFQGKDGGWRCKCQACGAGGDLLDVRAKATNKTRDAVIAEMNQTQNPTRRPVPKPTSTEKPKAVHPDLDALARAAEFSDDKRRKVAKTFTYTDPDTGWHDLVVFRLEAEGQEKTCRQGRQVAGGYVLCGCPDHAPLYNRARVRKAEVVVVVEGEPKVHALHDLGIVATCSPGGALAADRADWMPLNGKRLVTIWPDHDPLNPKTGKRPGQEYARTVMAQLAKLPNPPAVRLVDPATTELPEDGSDVVDLLRNMADLPLDERRELVQAILDGAEATGALAELVSETEDVIAGRIRAVDFPWGMLSNRTQALLPGSLTVWAGNPGNSKSLMVLQAMASWFDQGVKCSTLLIEDGVRFHLRRAQAQLCGISGLTLPDWIKGHPAEARAALDQAGEWLGRFARCLHEMPRRTRATVDYVVNWTRNAAASGSRIIVLDPVTQIDLGQSFFDGDRRLVTELKQVAEEYACSVLAISHGRKGAPTDLEKITLDDLAATAAWGRTCHCCVWLALHEETSDEVTTSSGRLPNERFNRTMKILKARNGTGHGKRIAFMFDCQTLRTREVGILS